MSIQYGPTHTVTIGDTLFPLRRVLYDENGNPYNLASYTVKFSMETTAGTEELAETTTGVTAPVTQTFTVDTTNDLIKANAHRCQKNDQILLTTTTTLPAGLATSTRYYVRDVEPNAFKVSLKPDGSVVDITDTGTGTHSLQRVGEAEMDIASANVDTAGVYYGWFVLDSGSEKLHWPPGNQHIRIDVVARGN